LINGVELQDILQEIFYISYFGNIPPSYIDELTLFEKDYILMLVENSIPKEEENSNEDY